MIWKTKKRVLIKVLEAVTGYSIKDILSDSRKDEYVKARAILIYYLRTIECMSLLSIGEFVGRDHSTVDSAIKRVESDEHLEKLFKNYKKIVYENL